MKLRATDWLVQTNATPLQVEAFNNIPIKRVGNATIYMRDVADVRLGGPPQVNAVLVDGKQSVLIVVMKSGEASTLEVVDGIKKAIPKIEQIAPPGTKIELLGDASVFVEDSIIDVLREMALASVLTGVVVLLFLGSWRATLIIATSIPLSILSAIICLHWVGQTINVMTLGGLALAVGILVDDATVMIENIVHTWKFGKPLETAIIHAANQICDPNICFDALHHYRLAAAFRTFGSVRVSFHADGRSSHVCHDGLIHPVENARSDDGQISSR